MVNFVRLSAGSSLELERRHIYQILWSVLHLLNVKKPDAIVCIVIVSCL